MRLFAAKHTASAPQARPLDHLAIADWDYSWLLRADGRDESEFHLLPRRVEELAERGFKVLRVDAWPHLVAADSHGQTNDDFTVIAHASSRGRRGSQQPRQVRPADKLLRLAQAAKEHGIRLWLTSWLLPDTQARRSQARLPADYVRIWHDTLDWLDQQNALDAVMAVDFGHHFPQQPASYGAWQHVFQRAPQLARQRWRAATPQQVERINDYLLQVPQQLRTLFPQLHFGLSQRLSFVSQLRELDMGEMDFIDLHLPTLLPRWRHRRRSDSVLETHHAFCLAHQSRPILGAGATSLPNKAGMAEICRLSDAWVDAALGEDINVINPCALARPGQPLWDEVSWLQQINRRINGG